MIQESAPSKNGQREKHAVGWDRKALIKEKAGGKIRPRQKASDTSPNEIEEPGFEKCSGRAEKTRSLDSINAGPSFSIVFMELLYSRFESDT
jgi:hypothetical protein